MIQCEAKNWGGRGLSPQSPIGVYTLAPKLIVLVHTKLDTFVCLCTSLNVLGGVQNRWSTEQVEYRTGGVQNRWSTEQVEYRTL